MPKVTQHWDDRPAHLTPNLALILQKCANCLWRGWSGCAGLPYPGSIFGSFEAFWKVCPNKGDGGHPGSRMMVRQAGRHPGSSGEMRHGPMLWLPFLVPMAPAVPQDWAEVRKGVPGEVESRAPAAALPWGAAY